MCIIDIDNINTNNSKSSKWNQFSGILPRPLPLIAIDIGREKIILCDRNTVRIKMIRLHALFASLKHFQGQAVYVYTAEDAWREALVTDIDSTKDIISVKIEGTDQVGHHRTLDSIVLFIVYC